MTEIAAAPFQGDRCGTAESASGQTVKVIDDDILALIRSAECCGRYSESFQMREQLLAAAVKRSEGSPDESHEVAAQAEELVRLYCCIALRLLNQNQFSDAFPLLVRADHLVSKGEGMLFPPSCETLRQKAMAAVKNNFGLFYFRTGDFEASVTFLRDAIAIEKQLGQTVSESPGATHLNLAQALMACRAEWAGPVAAVPALKSAVELLRQQASMATVSLQVEDASRLSCHAHRLLGRCFEEIGDFHEAADAFGAALVVLRALAARMPSQSASNRQQQQRAAHVTSEIRQLLEEQRRCQEKAARLPHIPLKATRPLPRVASRNQRGTKAHANRLAVTSNNTELQQERIVTSAATGPELPVTALRTIGAPVMVSGSIPLGQHRPVTQRASAALVRPTSAQPLQVNAHATDVDAADTLVPAAALDTRIAVQRARVIPTESESVLKKSDAGLASAYQSLDQKQQEAFDSLARLAAGLPKRPSRPQTAGSSRAEYGGNPRKVFPEEVLFGGKVGFPPSSQATASTQERLPVAPHASRPTSAKPRPPPVSAASVSQIASFGSPSGSFRKHPVGTEINATAAAEATTMPEVLRNSSVPASPNVVRGVPAQTAHQLRRSDSTSAVVRPAVAVEVGSPVTESDLGSQSRQAETIQRFAWARLSAMLIVAQCAKAQAHLEWQLRVKVESEQQAKRAAEELLLAERARMQRELDEAKLMLVSRRKSSGPPLAATLTTAVGYIATAAATSGATSTETAQRALADMVRAALDRKAADEEHRAEARQSVESVQVDINRIRSEGKAKRNAAIATVHRFAQAARSCDVVRNVMEKTREAVLLKFAMRRLHKFAARKILEFMQSVLIHRREKLRRIAAEHAETRRNNILQVQIAVHARARLSALLRWKMQFARVSRSAVLMQSCGRGFDSRRLMRVVQREKAAELARCRERAVRVIVRSMRSFIRRRRTLDRWEQITTNNMTHRERFAATLIQSVWKRHRYGRQPEALWRQRLDNKRRAERLAADERRHAEAVLKACACIQHAYRAHLARRQLCFRRRVRESQRLQYLVPKMEDAAARTIQHFYKLVAARAEAGRRRSERDAWARMARIRFEQEEEARRGQLTNVTPAVHRSNAAAAGAAVIQRVGRGHATRAALLSSPLSHSHHPKNQIVVVVEDSSPSALGSRSQSNVGSDRPLVHVHSSANSAFGLLGGLLGSISDVSHLSGASTDCGDNPSPTLFLTDKLSRQSTNLTGAVDDQPSFVAMNEPSESFVRKVLSTVVGADSSTTTSSSQLQVDVHATPHSATTVSSSRTASQSASASESRSPRRMQREGSSMEAYSDSPNVAFALTEAKSSDGTVRTRSSHSSQQSPKRIVTEFPDDQIRIGARSATRRSAVAVIVRFFRRIIRKRIAKQRRLEVLHHTIRTEAARFVQDAWRRYCSRRQRLIRETNSKQRYADIIKAESATVIQRCFRSHLVRRQRSVSTTD